MSLALVPVTQKQAFAFIEREHRHHGVPRGGLWWHGAADDDGILVGIAIVGRPVARGCDDGFTMEVTRLATTGQQNACSMLYSAARRAALSKGFRRGLTYILDSEWNRFEHVATKKTATDPALEKGGDWKRIGGASLEAAGWRYLWRVEGRSWNCETRPREDKHAFGWGAWRELAKAAA